MELFEGLTASEMNYLQYLQKRGYFDGMEMFLNLDTSSDYRIDKLVNNGYIILQDNGPYEGSCYVTITEKGIAALVDYHKKCKLDRLNTVLRFLAWVIPCLAGVIGTIFAYLSWSEPQ